MEHQHIEVAFTDARGTIADILYKVVIEHVAIITSKRGVVRGNHFHKLTTQHLYVVKGALEYFYEEIDKEHPGPRSIRLVEGDLVTSPPLEAHAMHFLEPTTMIVLSSGLRGGEDYEKDTYRVSSLVIPR
jgi:quercetin dioxygenase-like cupin family protein